MAYLEYTGQCIGRLMAFCYKLTHLSDSWCFGDGTITTQSGTVLGTYSWSNDGDGDVPIFEFTDPELKKLCNLRYEYIKKEILDFDEFLNRPTYSRKREYEENQAKAEARRVHIRNQILNQK